MPDKIHILYMEDNEGTARLLEKRLSRVGYAIDIAPNGEIGLERSAKRKYDAIILDHNMPGLSGLQVIEQLALRGRIPPTIMLTGTGNETIAVEALKLGAIDYVVKDIDGVYLDLLPTVIDQALGNQQLMEEKRRTEQALVESEKRFRSVVEMSVDGIVLIDHQGRIVEWNKAEERITGIHREDALGQFIWDISYQILPGNQKTESARQRFKDLFLELQQASRDSVLDIPVENDIELADGTIRTIQSVKFPIKMNDYVLVCDITRDMTERKRTEVALRESEERFRMLFELAPDPIFVNDLEGNLIACNRAAESLVGLHAEDLIGKNYLEMGLFTTDQLQNIATILSDASDGSLARPIELSLARVDGREIVIDLHLMPIQTKGETQLLGIGHEITWRKQAEAQMQAHIERLETLRQIDDELTRRLDIDYVQSMALSRMIHLSHATAGSIALIIDKKISNVYSTGYPEELNAFYSLDNRSVVARVMKTRKAEWIQDVSTDTDYFSVLADTCSQITIPLVSQERLIGVVSLETNQSNQFNAEMFEFLKLIAARIAVAIDNAQLYDNSQKQLIELQYLYEQIRELEQLKSDMMRIVSHDLRNPLSVIATSTDLLQRSLGTTIAENQQRYLGQIGRSLNRMKALTTDVLSLENIEQLARGETNTDTVDLLVIIHDIVESLHTQAEHKHLVMDFSVPNSPLMIQANKTELQQAATNLIDNAIKYTPVNGKINITLRRTEGTVTFEVTDTGYGIPEKSQVNLFQPFARVKTEETKSIDGTGLGLYIVKKIVDRNGGEIIFYSKYGHGSTFGFSFPLVSDDA